MPSSSSTDDRPPKDPPLAKHRSELLLKMYDQMFNDINRHILVVWQSAGTVIGESAPFTVAAQPANAGFAPVPQVVTAPLKPTTGKHDLYFIYKNDNAPPTQALFILTNILYHHQ